MRLRCLAVMIACWCVASAARAQVLQGDWVEESERRIEEHRKVDLRVIVLGRDGQPAPGARVRIEQLRHDFTLGFVVGDAGLPADAMDRPVYRLFNAVALDRVTAWRRTQGEPAPPDFSRVAGAIADAHALGLAPRWGGLVPGDIARAPEWAAGLGGPALRTAVDAYVAAATRRFGGVVTGFDPYTGALGHDWLGDRLGAAAVRGVYELAEASAPDATLAVRFEDPLTPQRAGAMIRRVTDLRLAFLPVSTVSIDQRVGGLLAPGPLRVTLETLRELDVGVLVTSLEVGGPSDSSAAVNLETFLRVAFAEPAVRAIYFTGLSPEDVADPTAALVDLAGDPTPPGSALEHFFGSAWWTNLDTTADDLGNVYARVFAGAHRVTATLPTGETLETTVYARSRETQRVVVLEWLGSGAGR